ncbi:MAG: hypothetical protein NC221_03555 [Duncaniella sp.]|nr:hypothetical protein [Muribaculum sp.]MCM1255178.1 hypothetical protein [Duncaniella sp.]
MNYSISVTSIIETMQAVASLYLLSNAGCNSAIVASLFPERRELLESLVKDAFAETLIEMLPYVDDSNIDDAESDEILRFSIGAFDKLPQGVHSIIRRNIEQSLAYRIIHLCLLSSQEKSIGTITIEEIARKSTCFLDSALTLIHTAQTPAPFIR